LLDVGSGERRAIQYSLPPHVEEGVVEGREPLRCCRRHLDDLYQLLTAPIVEGLDDLAFVVDGCFIEEQEERVAIERACRLREEVANVLQ
jgi:hypothetical protein